MSAESTLQTYTLDEVAAHKSADDIWVVIRGKVYNITDYIYEHPGGEDILLEVAGKDATEGYEDNNHSDIADELLSNYLIGSLGEKKAPTETEAQAQIEQTQPEQAQSEQTQPELAQSEPEPTKEEPVAEQLEPKENDTEAQSSAPLLPAMPAMGLLAGLFFGAYAAGRDSTTLKRLIPSWVKSLSFASSAVGRALGSGILSAFALATTVVGLTGRRTENKEDNQSPSESIFLSPNEFKSLPLVRKESVSHNVIRYTFALPHPRAVLGLPIGQHISIKADINGKTVSRSYTPISNDSDLGVLELIIKLYPDGLMTSQYFANLEVGDTIQVRGPKGAMKYERGLCKHLGMVAGGTGITPMYQLIRAICEDAGDDTKISLIYANRTEADILLREELEEFAFRYPHKFEVWYMLDHPGEGWRYGTGFVTKDVLREKLPPATPDTKVLLCGPPGMINATRNALTELGFEKGSLASKMSDQVFCF